ncbi:MAG: hypothetical protein GXZ07_01710 [Firmicutes bacterium]|nr:hypothetical protein [Bacillota bacterium]
MVFGSFVKEKFVLVMRFLLPALSVFLLLTAFSCSPGGDLKGSGSHEDKSGFLTGSDETEEKDPHQNDDFNGKLNDHGEANNEGQDSSFFKMLVPDGALHRVEGLPEYFLAEGWIDEENFFGLTGTHCLSVSLLGKGTRSLVKNAWSAQVSPDGRKLSYLDENGINQINTDGSGHKFLWPEGESGSPFLEGRPAGGIWSPDGEKILCWYEHEWDCDFFCLRPGNNHLQALNTAMEGYFLASPAGWIDDSRLLFNIRASRKKDGTQEYSLGYRCDLAVYDLSAGTFEMITGAEDGEFIEAADLSPSMIAFRRYYGEAADLTHGVMDYSGRVLWEKDLGRVLSLSLSPDEKKIAYLVEEAASAADSNAAVKLVVKEGAQEKEVASLLVGDHLKGPFWSPAGDSILLSFSSRLPAEDSAGSLLTHYTTLIILP